MKINPLTRQSAWLAVAAVAAVPIGASAQVLEEVVVTAQKREQNIQDVGISVTAFSGDQIEALGMTNTGSKWLPGRRR